MEKVDVEARARKARELFMSGYNCSQSVFLAYADLYGIDPKFYCLPGAFGIGKRTRFSRAVGSY